MSLPANLDPSSSDVGFGGNVKLQCANGTFPECRPLLVRHLNIEVERGHLEQKDANKRLADADALWNASEKNPEILAKVEERLRLKNEYEDAICQACSNQIEELRGVPYKSLVAVIIEDGVVVEAEESVEKKPRGRPKKNT